MEKQDVQKAWKWLQIAQEDHLFVPTSFFVKAINFFIQCDSPQYAWPLCQWMQQRNASVHGNLLLQIAQGFLAANQLDEAFDVAQMMQSTRRVQLPILVADLIRAKAAAHDLAGAQGVFNMAVESQLDSDGPIVSALMEAFLAAGDAEAGFDFFKNRFIPAESHPTWQKVQAEVVRALRDKPWAQ